MFIVYYIVYMGQWCRVHVILCPICFTVAFCVNDRKRYVGLLFCRDVHAECFFYLVEISLMKIIGWCQLALWQTSVEFEFFFIFFCAPSRSFSLSLSIPLLSSDWSWIELQWKQRAPVSLKVHHKTEQWMIKRITKLARQQGKKHTHIHQHIPVTIFI